MGYAQGLMLDQHPLLWDRRETYGFSHEEYAELQKRLAVTPRGHRVESDKWQRHGF